jgi:hypothetical protein
MTEYQQALNSMGESGVVWIDTVFRYCVYILVEAAKWLGTSYEALNVWLFVFILPGLLAASLVTNVVLWKKRLNPSG